MRRLLNMLAAMFLMAAISFSFTVPACAASPFVDVAPDSPYQESLEYLAERNIVAGIGGDQFSPDAPLTVRQWAIMLCRAYGAAETGHAAPDFGLDCVEQCVKNGWLNITAYSDPDTQICWAALLESAFNAKDIPVYSYELYPDGAPLSSQENLLRIGMDLELCEGDTAPLQVSTRGEAAQMLYQLLTQSFEITPPPSPIPIQNHADIFLNSYQLELSRVPQPILHVFQSRGWSYVVDFEYLEQYSREIGITCIGLTDYSKKQVFVSEASSTLHEMGHFLHSVIGFPKDVEALYQEEAPAAAKLLRQYALENSHEYFANCFAYWISYRDNVSRMERFQQTLPATYRFFAALEAEGWDYGSLLRLA